MATALLSQYYSDLPPPQMSLPVALSLAFHTAVVILLITGLPYLKSDPPDIFAESMTVELVSEEAADKEMSKTPEKKAEKPSERPDHIKQMPQVLSKTPPKPAAPERPDPVPLPDTTKSESVEKTEAPPAPKPKKRPTAVKAEPELEENPEEFQSLLRNLMPAEPEGIKNEAGKTEQSPLERFSQQMTMSEHDALRRQLGQCWKLLAGARYAEDLIVDIKLYMNPDRTIRDAQVVDQMRYIGDSYFRAAADAAMRAVQNPMCNPLELPPNKYDQWKTITVTFDPRAVL